MFVALHPKTFFFPTSLCGVLVFGCALPSAPPASCLPPPSHTHTQLSNTQLTRRQHTHTHTHTHIQLAHTQHSLTHTDPHSHTQLPHTHNLLTHTTLSHTHTTLSHTTPSHTTCSHTTYSHTQLSHTQLHHTQLHHKQLFHTQLSHTQLSHTHTHNLLTHTTPSHTHSVAGVALGDIQCPLRRRLGTRRHGRAILRGKRGTYGAGLALVVRLVPVCRRGRRGCLHGKHGAWRYRLSFCVAGVALGDIDQHFVWQAWHLWHWAGSGGALGSRLSPRTPGLFAWQACGIWKHRPPFCVASGHLATSTLVTQSVILRGRRCKC